MRLALLLVAAVLAPGLSGCLDFLEAVDRPDYAVSRTPVAVGSGAWNTEGRFLVQVNQAEPVEVVIEARPAAGAGISARGLSDADTPVSLAIPDGTWTIQYSVGGHEWETFKGARFDSTPPEVTGLEAVGSAPGGSYTLGAAAVVEPGARIEVVEQATGRQVAFGLPASLAALADGVHTYDVVASDEAGNEAVWTVQVIVGSASVLPKGQLTMGIVARYTTTVALWDIADLASWATPQAARQAQPSYLGEGTGIEPQDPRVQAVVDAVVDPGMTTGEAALALYRWMFDQLEYDEARLGETGLLSPAETLDAEGGVCRDLAALYVSLLRGAGVPARLVAGYLAGRVDGFHAWVEVYGGPGHGPSPWVPVDVSGIDGPYDEVGMLQAFGVRLPDYLMLRALTPSQEQGNWSSVMTVLPADLPPGSRRSPDLDFDNRVDEQTNSTQALCINKSTYARTLRALPAGGGQPSCPTNQRSYIAPFVTTSTRLLDYGIVLESAAAGTRITMEAVYPDLDDNTADRVDYQYYVPAKNASCTVDDRSGRIRCTMTA